MESTEVKAIAEKLGLKFNSLEKPEAMAFIALGCEETIGCTVEEGLAIAEMLDDFAGINYSQMRQKIAKVVWGKTPEKGVKANAKDRALALLSK